MLRRTEPMPIREKKRDALPGVSTRIDFSIHIFLIWRLLGDFIGWSGVEYALILFVKLR